MKNQNFPLPLFTVFLTAFPLWLPLFLWIGCQLTGRIPPHDSAGLYEKHWNIQFSADWKEAYHADSGPSFHGDGERYSIYENVSGSSISDSGIPFIKGRNDTIKEAFQSLADTLGVEEEKQPDFTEPCIWARLSGEGGDYLVMLFVPEENKLFVAERLT